MTIALVGDLRYGRAVHSLCKLLCLYEQVKLHLIAPELSIPEEIEKKLAVDGHQVETFTDMAKDKRCDIIYVTRTQEERFQRGCGQIQRVVSPKPNDLYANCASISDYASTAKGFPRAGTRTG